MSTKKTQRKWKTKVARVAKAVSLRNIETKRFTGDITQTTIYKNGGATAGSNAAFVIKPLDLITNGTDDGNRVGNSITLKRMNWRFLFDNNANNNVKWRVTIGWMNAATVASLTNVYIGGNDVVSRFVRRPLDQLAIFTKVIHDSVHNQMNQYTAQGQLAHVHINIPMHNKKYEYASVSTTAVGGNTESLQVIITGSLYGGTDLTTAIGSVDGFFSVWYKDG